MKFYNTASRQLETFKPITPGRASIYSCGPTVYWRQHLGNLRKDIFDDLLRRALTANGYTVYAVKNLTDVGHLTNDDTDQGDDKMEIAAQKENLTATQVAQKYTDLWKADDAKLNITEFNHYPKATDYIHQQIQLIKRLETKGYTYVTSDGVYFDTAKFPQYGDFAKLDLNNLQAGARVEMGDKKNPADFALWKFSQPPGTRQQEWESPWGIGFPGWHSECVVMSDTLLHTPFDIHTGGKEHIAIHHTNEIAQVQADTGHGMANYWLHSYHLTLDGSKMSKSKGTIITLDDLIEKGYHPLEYRLLMLMAHYRTDSDLSWTGMDQAKATLKRLREFIDRVSRQPHQKNPDIQCSLKKLEKTFRNSINTDLDTPRALAAIFEFIRETNVRIDTGEPILKRQIIKAFIKFDRVLGLDFVPDPRSEDTQIPESILKLAQHRDQARADKNFTEADTLRDQLQDLGYEVKDTPQGTVVTKK